VIESALEDVCAALSVTCTVKFELLAAVGVPLIVPVADSIKPAGNDPEIKDQEYGGRPPVAVRVAEYAVFTVPAANDVVVIESATPTLSVKLLLTEPELASRRVTTTEN